MDWRIEEVYRQATACARRVAGGGVVARTAPDAVFIERQQRVCEHFTFGHYATTVATHVNIAHAPNVFLFSFVLARLWCMRTGWRAQLSIHLFEKVFVL